MTGISYYTLYVKRIALLFFNRGKIFLPYKNFKLISARDIFHGAIFMSVGSTFNSGLI